MPENLGVAQTKSSPTDVVTEMDTAAEKTIRAAIRKARPEDGFLGEEGGAEPGASGVRWVVDPIDGTVNFLYGIPEYAVSIAAEVDGEVVAGVVLDVAKDVLYAGHLGGPATRDGVPLTVRGPAPLAHRLVATGFNYTRPVREVQAWVAWGGWDEDRQLAGTSEFSPREDAAGAFAGTAPHPLHPQGWRLRFALPPEVPRSAFLHLRAIDGRGHASTLYAATVDAALLRSVRLELRTAEAERLQERAEGEARLAQLRAEGAYERSVLEARLAAMEASRFWKLRELWWRLRSGRS